MKCNNCGSDILKGEEFCPVCNSEITESETPKPGRYKKAVAYIINAVLALGAYVFAFVWSVRLTSAKDAAKECGRFSKEAIHIAKYTHLTDLWMAVFLTLALIYIIAAIYFSLRKIKNKFSIFGLCFCLMLTLTASVASYAYSKNYTEADVISIKDRSDLTFAPVSVRGKVLPVDSSVEFNLYSYYVTFACAYNDLARTGDYKAFFDTVNENNFQNLNYHLYNLKSIYLSETAPDNYRADKVPLPQDIPYKSITSGSIPSNLEIIEALKYSSDGKTKDKLVEKYIERANILFDTFYGKELICEKAISYNAKKYIGEFRNPNGRSTLNIESLSLDKEGNGEICFYYSPTDTRIKGKVTNRKCVFEYAGEYSFGRGLIHITQNNIIVNISEDNNPAFSKSDNFRIAN